LTLALSQGLGFVVGGRVLDRATLKHVFVASVGISTTIASTSTSIASSSCSSPGGPRQTQS